MVKILKNLLSDSSEISHKRFISISAFIVLTGMVIGKFFKLELDNSLIYTFAGLCSGYSIMSVVDKKLNDKSNEKNTTIPDSTVSDIQ